MGDRKFNIAIVGATGAVGTAMLHILQQRNFPVKNLYALASAGSSGRTLSFGNTSITVQSLADFDFSDVQIALFSAGASVSEKYAPVAVKAGCIVIDNTSQFRYIDDIPLVVPEVNPQAMLHCRQHGIIANPNCSTIQMVVALKPIYDAVGIERINVCTYQAVSGTGVRAIEELLEQSRLLLQGEQKVESEVYPMQIAFNVLPHIDTFQENGYTREEMKMVWETRKILQDDSIQVNPTAVRVPVLYGHSEAIHIETRELISVDNVKKLLQQAPGVSLFDEDSKYPDAATTAAGQDSVYVGRVRKDISHPKGINLWVVADNLRKGAALNSIQIAERLITKSALIS